MWELPLWEEYHELIKGDAADYKNSGGRAGGAITAAAFLSKFTGGIPWVHLDIAGPAWLTKEKPYIPKGASGVGVRLLIQFLRNVHRMGQNNGSGPLEHPGDFHSIKKCLHFQKIDVRHTHPPGKELVCWI